MTAPLKREIVVVKMGRMVKLTVAMEKGRNEAQVGMLLAESRRHNLLTLSKLLLRAAVSLSLSPGNHLHRFFFHTSFCMAMKTVVKQVKSGIVMGQNPLP